MLKEAVIQLLEEGTPREKLTTQAKLNRTTYYCTLQRHHRFIRQFNV